MAERDELIDISSVASASFIDDQMDSTNVRGLSSVRLWPKSTVPHRQLWAIAALVTGSNGPIADRPHAPPRRTPDL
jgi:hypothetical protein